MDPRRLLVFREVGRAGSLAGAARALGWTQPAVSQHVRRLEADTGTPLVVRAGRGVALTEAGRVLLRHADAVAERLAAAEQDLAALSGLVAGQVRVGAFPTAAAVLLPPVLADLLGRAPRLDVRFVELEPPEAEAAVRSGEARRRGRVPPRARQHAGRGRPRCASRCTGTRCSPSCRPARRAARPRRPRRRALDRRLPALPLAPAALRRRPRLRARRALRHRRPRRRAAPRRPRARRRAAARAGRCSRRRSPRSPRVPVTGVDERVVEVLVRPDARRIAAVAAVLAGLREAAAATVR